MPTENPESVTPAGEQATGTKDNIDPYDIPLEDLRSKIEGAQYAGENPERIMGDMSDDVEETAILDIESPPEEQPLNIVPDDPDVERVEEPKAEPEPEDQPVEAAAADEPEEATEEAPVSEMDVLRAKVEQAELQAKLSESELGRQAGEDGYFKQKFLELQEQVRTTNTGPAPQETDDSLYREPQQPQQPQQPRQVAQDDTANMRSYINGIALRDGGNEFFAANPGVYVDDGNGNKVMDPEFEKAMQASGIDPNALMQSNDPTYVRGAVTQAMQTAYSHVQVGRQKAHIADLERRKSDELEKLRNKKRVSSASSPAPAKAAPRATTEDPWKMPMEKLKAKLDKARDDQYGT